jgi:hypothetical protein
MAIATEAAPTGMFGPNLAGISTLSENATIPFFRYVRHVLPLDGYVFWLKVEAVEAQGSVHVLADKRQNEDETIAINRVVFTTDAEVQQFNAIRPNQIWVGETQGVRFAFSRSGPRYQQSGLFHYQGDAVYPAMESQLIDVVSELSPDQVIVSNSLPAWLRLVHYDPVWLQIPNPCVMLYPSFAVPDNLRPPYGSVHIDPGQTKALQAFPALNRVHTTQHQLASDRVRITLYGLTSAEAMNFVALVNRFSEDTDAIGMMDTAVLRDEKRTQAELGILAMKKTIEYSVSYQQGAIRDVARALIKSASATVSPIGV